MSSRYTLLAKLMAIALILNLLPIFAMAWSPMWLLLGFVYWLVYAQHPHPTYIALLLGLFFDIMLESLMGQNALALIVASIFILQFKQSFIFSNNTTALVYVFGASLVYLTIVYIIQIIHIGAWYFDGWFLLSPITTAILWPIIRIFIDTFPSKNASE